MYKPSSSKLALLLGLLFVGCMATTSLSFATGVILPAPGALGRVGSSSSLSSSSSSSSSPSTTIVPTETTDRRDVLKQLWGISISWMVVGSSCPMVSWAATDPTTGTVLLRGRVSLAPETTTSTSTPSSSAALYITCRPNRPDNVPMAILNGSRGKPPPVLSARIPLSSKNQPPFPLDFELQIPRDLTVEGAWDGTTVLSTDGDSSMPPVLAVVPTSVDQLWWKQDELIISARLDSDGVAATRSPDDLVGRAIGTLDPIRVVELQLTGRGAFGKFATAKQ